MNEYETRNPVPEVCLEEEYGNYIVKERLSEYDYQGYLEYCYCFEVEHNGNCEDDLMAVLYMMIEHEPTGDLRKKLIHIYDVVYFY